MAMALEFALENVNSAFKFEAVFNNKKIRESLNCISCMSNHSVFGIGPMYPRDMSYLWDTDGTFVSYYSSNDHLSDNSYESSMFSIVPPNSFRIQALLDIVRALEWKHVSVISSYGENGRTAAQYFIDKIEKANSCLDFHLELPLKRATKKLEEIQKINSSAIISFTMAEDTVNVIRYLDWIKDRKPQMLFAFGTIHFEEVGGKPTLSKTANGSLFLDFVSLEIPQFSTYICQNNCNKLKHRLFPPVWCIGNNSRVSMCEGSKPKHVSYAFTPYHLIMAAVYSLVDAIENSAKDDIEFLGMKARQKLVRKYLNKNTKCNYILENSNGLQHHNSIMYDIINFASYDKGRKYNLTRVGTWIQNRTECDNEKAGKLQLNMTDIIWMSESKGKPDNNQPGITCRKNEIQRRSEGVIKGRCWMCHPCSSNDKVFNNTCFPCKRDSKPNEDLSSCITLHRDTLIVKAKWQAKLILALSLTSLFPVSFVAFIFLKHKNLKVVKASGRELCTFILIGILITFLSPVIFILSPGQAICSLRQLLPGLGMCLCYAPLFLKVNRIYRIFVNSDKLEKTQLASPQSQVLLVLGITVFQVTPGCIWIMKSIPDAKVEYPDHRNYVLIHCPIDHSGFFLNLIFPIIFMFGSTWYAFKTRAFPRNFNESKYIGISLYIICLIWSLFVPAFFYVKRSNEFLNEYMICSLCISVGYTTLSGLFISKVRRILTSSKHEGDASIKDQMSTTFSVSTFQTAEEILQRAFIDKETQTEFF